MDSSIIVQVCNYNILYHPMGSNNIVQVCSSLYVTPNVYNLAGYQVGYDA